MITAGAANTNGGEGGPERRSPFPLGTISGLDNHLSDDLFLSFNVEQSAAKRYLSVASHFFVKYIVSLGPLMGNIGSQPCCHPREKWIGQQDQGWILVAKQPVYRRPGRDDKLKS